MNFYILKESVILTHGINKFVIIFIELIRKIYLYEKSINKITNQFLKIKIRFFIPGMNMKKNKKKIKDESNNLKKINPFRKWIEQRAKNNSKGVFQG